MSIGNLEIDQVAKKLAESYVSRQNLLEIDQPKAVFIATYNVKVIAFNLATIIAITAVALGVIMFLSLHTTFLVAGVFSLIRYGLTKELEFTALTFSADTNNRKSNDTFHINYPEDWKANSLVIGGHVLWKNFLHEVPPKAEQGILVKIGNLYASLLKKKNVD